MTVGLFERGGLFRPTNSWGAQVKTHEIRKRCPPIEDCPVKQSLMASAAEQKLWGVKTKKEVRTAKAKAARIAKQQRAGRKTDTWPYKGKYDPTKGKARGK